MGLFQKMSCEQAYAVLKSGGSSNGDLKKAEKVIKELNDNDPRKMPYTFLSLTRQQDFETAYFLFSHEISVGELSELMLAVLNQPIVCYEFIIGYSQKESLWAGFYLARAYENGWGIERDHEKAVEIVSQWSDMTGEYARIAERVRNEILSAKAAPPAPAAAPEPMKNEDIATGLSDNKTEHITNNSTACADTKKSSAMSADEAFDIAQALWEQEKYEEANRYYEIAAQQGHPKAINCLGYAYRLGVGVKKDVRKALEYFEAALTAGNPKGGANIGMVYYNGEGDVEADFDKAFPYLLKAARAGISYVMPALSDMYYQGLSGEDNEKLAAYFAYQAIMNGEQDGYYMLGMCFEEGIFFPECPAVAKYCFEKAAEVDYDVAEYLESEQYLAVDSVEPDFIKFNDDDPAFFTQECPARQYLRAVCLLDGTDTDGNAIPVDAAGGRKLLEQAAAQGYAEAQYSLGTRYLNTGDGDGVRYNEDGSVEALGCDTAKALYYLNLAARQGHSDALDALIDLYNAGEIDIEQDTAKSREYQAIKYRLFQDEDDRSSAYDADEGYDEEDEEENSEDDGKVVRIDYDGGAYYIGTQKNGKRNGHGKYVFSDGSYYEGDFLNGDSHGIGTRIYSNGDKFHGRWQNDYKNGLGRMDYTDGSWYFGQFEDNAITGYGVYFDGELFRIGRFEDGVCVTENNVKQTMKRPSLTDIGDGVKVYCDFSKDPDGYSIFRSDKQIIYGKNDGSWITRYNYATKRMEMGTIDSESRLNDKNAVILDVDQLLVIGNVEGGVPNGFNTLHYVTGEIIESMFTNGEPSKIIRMIDKFGNEKTS